MRKLFILLAIIIPLSVFGILILNNRSTTPENSNAQNPSTTPLQSNLIEVDGFAIASVQINNLENVKLIPNFKEKLSSKEVIKNNNCSILTSAGFYAKGTSSAYKTSDNIPIGLFVSDGNKLSSWQENPLFDGILSINYLLTPRITRTVPQDDLKNAIQTGPIIKENGDFKTLRLTNDSEDRRMLGAVTGDNELFFITIYDKNSEYSGPLLSAVPNIIKDFETKTGIIFADVINLDGGSASAFAAKNNELFEISSVGAFFCQF